MSRPAIEAIAFVALALAIHVGYWLRMPEGTLAASGAGGDAVISMAAVTPQMIEMIEAFETPPDMVESPPTANLLEPVAPVQDIAPPPPPGADAPARSTAQELPDMDISGVDLPTVQAPPPTPEPPEVAVEPPIDLSAVALLRETAPEPPEPAPQEPARTASPELALLTPPPNPAFPPPPAFEPPPPPPTQPNTAEATSPRPPVRPESLAPPVPPEPQRQATPAAPPPPQQAVPSNRSQEGRAEQRAAGSGGGQAAGNSGQSQTASLSSTRRESLLANWGSKIRSRVERRKSPPRGVQGTGTSTVRLVVTTDGRLASLSLVRSSGIAAFDEAALNAVRRAGRFAKAPRALGSGQHSFTLPIQFQR